MQAVRANAAVGRIPGFQEARVSSKVKQSHPWILQSEEGGSSAACHASKKLTTPGVPDMTDMAGHNQGRWSGASGVRVSPGGAAADRGNVSLCHQHIAKGEKVAEGHNFADLTDVEHAS